MADLLALDPNYMMLPIDEAPFVINANTRDIAAPKIVTLQNDQLAEMVIFTIDRYYDYMDLYNAHAYVQWTLPSGKEGATAIEFRDLETIPGKIRFGWPLDSEVTAEVGTVKYSVRFWQRSNMVEDGEEVDKVVYSFNTLTSSFVVSPSLQVKLNDDIDVNKPLNQSLFKRAIQNSTLTGEGYIVPTTPLFSEPGLDLPIYASLKYNSDEDTAGTLTLKAQAVVGDTGKISYEWYYKPAITETIQNKEFSSSVFYPYKDEHITDENGQETVVKGFNVYGGIVNDNYFESIDYSKGFEIGEEYYEKDETAQPLGYKVYAGLTPPTDGRVLYQRFTTYTVPSDGDVKVTGEYYVRAINSIAVAENQKEVTSTPCSSRVCHLVSPDNVIITKPLAAEEIIENGEALLSININSQTNKQGVVTKYEWMRDIVNPNFEEEQFSVEHTLSPNYTATTQGWYKVKATVLLNRESKSAVSTVCRVIKEPQLPILNYTEAVQEMLKDLPEGTIPQFTDQTKSEQTLTVVPENIVPDGYAKELFSDEMTYTWYMGLTDSGIMQKLTQDNPLIISGFGEPSLTVKTTDNTSRTYTCYITNTLGGKSVTSNEQQAKSFVVM